MTHTQTISSKKAFGETPFGKKLRNAGLALAGVASMAAFAAAPAEASSRVLVQKVVQVEVTKLNNGRFNIRAVACFNTGGWSDGNLHLKGVDSHGNYRFEYKAVAPTGIVTQAFSTLAAERTINTNNHNRPVPQSVTVAAAQNSLTAHVAGQSGTVGSGTCF